MITRTYNEDAETGWEAEAHSERARLPYRDAGAQIFLWIAWTLAFAVWAFFMIVDVGIFQAIAAGGPSSLRGGVAGGSGYVLFSVLGVVALGVVMAWAAVRWATRDRRLDPGSEAATGAMYDSIQRGDDVSATRRAEARASHRRSPSV